MSKNIEKQYLKLLKDILDNGVEKDTRNGKTLSVFGRQIRHDMSKGFPLLTTKKMYWKGIVTELLWFLRGDTNIKYLVDNDCHIWDGDAYKAYLKGTERFGKKWQLDKEEYINRIKTDDEFAKQWGSLGKIYGHQWRNWNGYKKTYQKQSHHGGSFGGPTQVEYGELVEYDVPGIDQISDLIKQLKENPDSRRLLVSAWNASDLPHQVLPPCHYGFQVYTRELDLEERRYEYFERLSRPEALPRSMDSHEYFDSFNIPTRAISLQWNQRSVDTPLGLPFNIASYALLLEIIARSVNMVPGELIGNLGDCHIYKNQIDGVKEQLTRTPMKLPKIDIHPGILDYDLDKLEVDMFKLVDYQSHSSIKMPLSN